MGVPKRRKSKAKSRLGRTHYKLKKPALSRTGDDEVHTPHRVGLDGMYNGRDYSKYVKSEE